MRGGKSSVKFEGSCNWLRRIVCLEFIGWSWEWVGENDGRHGEWVLKATYLAGDGQVTGIGRRCQAQVICQSKEPPDLRGGARWAGPSHFQFGQ